MTPAGMVLDGSTDRVEGPPSANGELDPALVDHLEFYLLNYFKPASGRQTDEVVLGRALFAKIGCTDCHVSNLKIDRPVATEDVCR